VKLGQPRVAASVEIAIGEALKAKASIRKIAATLGVGVGTVQRVKAEMRAA
jgi:hypothetical protein